MSSNSKKRETDAPSKQPSQPSTPVSSPKKKEKSKKKVVEEEEEPVKEETKEEKDFLELTLSSDDSSDEDDEDSAETASSSTSTSEQSNDGVGSTKKKLSWIQKKKKGFASRAAGSSLGASLLQKHVDKETQSLISSVCRIIAHEKSPKHAKKVKQEILRVAVKILLLYHEKTITEESFETLKFSFRRICSSVRNAYHAKSLNEATGKRIHEMALVFYHNLEAALMGLVSSKTLQRLKALINLVFDPPLLVSATQYTQEFQQIAMVLAHYLESSS